MVKEKIRGLDNMPFSTKLKYCKILFIMAGTDKNITSLEITELYRLMANIKLPQDKRIMLLSDMDTSQGELKDICNNIFDGLNHQERNILRFSLIKDLIIVMRADHYESPQEREIFYQIKYLLSITEEQLSLIEEEYEEDILFYHQGITENKGRRMQELISITTAVSVPIASLYIKESVRKDTCIFKKPFRFRSKKHQKDILKSIAIGAISYNVVKWWLGRRVNEEELMQGYVLKRCTNIQERAIDYLKKDINYIQGHLQDIEGNSRDIETLKQRVLLLKKSLGQLKISKPRLL